MTRVFASKDNLLVQLEHLVDHLDLVLLRHLLDLVEGPLAVFFLVVEFIVTTVVLLVELALLVGFVFFLEALHLMHHFDVKGELKDAHDGGEEKEHDCFFE